MRVEIHRLGILAVLSALIALLALACDPGTGQSEQDRASNSSSDKEISVEGQQAQHKPGEGSTGEAVAADSLLLAEGKKAWRSCGTCHCTTDPRIKEDEDWVLLNEETTCIEAGKPAPRVRESVIAYLRHPETLRPDLIDQDYEPDKGKETGQVLVSAMAGSAHVKAGRDSIRKGSPSMIRLYWRETEEEKSMVMPAGEYVVINYWLYCRGGKGGEERWMVTGTNVDGCTELNIDPGEEAYFGLDSVVYGEFTSARKDDGFKLSFSLHDVWGNRMTLSKNGRIIMPGYRILDGKGKTLAEGVFAVI